MRQVVHASCPLCTPTFVVRTIGGNETELTTGESLFAGCRPHVIPHCSGGGRCATLCHGMKSAPGQAVERDLPRVAQLAGELVRLHRAAR
jgi:hypothetical protein